MNQLRHQGNHTLEGFVVEQAPVRIGGDPNQTLPVYRRGDLAYVRMDALRA